MRKVFKIEVEVAPQEGEIWTLDEMEEAICAEVEEHKDTLTSNSGTTFDVIVWDVKDISGQEE